VFAARFGPVMSRCATDRPIGGRYLLVDQIGEGGMGTVWRAWDQREHRFVAAKVLGPHDASTLLRSVREQSMRIAHPHVVAPDDRAAEDHTVVLAMDLVRGGSADRLLIRHGPLPEDYVAVLLDQLLRALAAVHAAGVVHRDVKPANLLLEPTGTGRPLLRLGDFGVAAFVDEPRLTRVPGSVGTDGYIAPEQSAGAPPHPRQDLWSAAVTAVELLAGRRPVGPEDVPAGRLQPLLVAMLDPDPDGRPPSAEHARAWLDRLGVREGAPWQRRPHPPDVTDRYTDLAVPAVVTTRRTAWALACFVTAIALCVVSLVITLSG
jgi:eukaryotic-like serine/threonine-protein kinase